MRKLVVLALGAALATPGAVVAAEKAAVATKVFISNSLQAGGGDAELIGGLTSRSDACLERRKIVVFADDDKLGGTKAKRGAWTFTTGAVGLGDSVYAKVKRKVVETDRGRVTCKGNRSRQFVIGS